MGNVMDRALMGMIWIRKRNIKSGNKGLLMDLRKTFTYRDKLSRVFTPYKKLYFQENFSNHNISQIDYQ